MLKNVTIFATVVGFAFSVATPKAKAFETFLDPGLEIGAAYVFLQQTENDLKVLQDYANNGYYFDKGYIVYDSEAAAQLKSQVGYELYIIRSAKNAVYNAYTFLGNWDFQGAVQALATALVGEFSGAGLIYSNTLDTQALLNAWEDGSGLNGSPGGSWTYSWYALWVTYYAYLDLYSLVLYDFEGSSSSGGSSGAGHQNAGTINDN